MPGPRRKTPTEQDDLCKQQNERAARRRRVLRKLARRRGRFGGGS